MQTQYHVAQGATELEQRLIELQSIAKDSNLTQIKHYIFFQLGEQKSIILVDIAKVPFEFWYYDLLGRPATIVVKNIIADFSKQNFGVINIH